MLSLDLWKVEATLLAGSRSRMVHEPSDTAGNSDTQVGLPYRSAGSRVAGSPIATPVRRPGTEARTDLIQPVSTDYHAILFAHRTIRRVHRNMIAANLMLAVERYRRVFPPLTVTFHSLPWVDHSSLYL